MFICVNIIIKIFIKINLFKIYENILKIFYWLLILNYLKNIKSDDLIKQYNKFYFILFHFIY